MKKSIISIFSTILGFILYALSAFVALIGILSLKDTIIGGSLIFIAAISITPAFVKFAKAKIHSEYDLKNSFGLFFFLVATGIVLLIVSIPNSNVASRHTSIPLHEASEETLTEIKRVEKTSGPSKTVTAQELYSEIAPQDDPKKTEYMAIVESYSWEITHFDLAAIKDGPSIESVLFKLKSYAEIYYESEKHVLTIADRKHIQEYKLQLIAFQRKAFPKMRNVFGPYVRQKGWEYDITGKTLGVGFSILEISGSQFNINKNIQSLATTMMPLLVDLRFKEARFKAHKDLPEFHAYTIASAKDDEIVLSGN